MATGGPRVLENIKKETTCALCLDLFEEPKTLPACLHTFCKSCLVRANAARRRLRGGDVATETAVEEIECPQCRTFSLVEGGAEALTTNFMYVNIIQHLRSGDSDTAVEISVEPRPERRVCPKHPDEVLKLYCFDCLVVICRDCTIIDHKDHKLDFVSKLATGERVRLVKLVSSLSERLARLHRARESAGDVRRELERVGEERAGQVGAEFDNIVEKIEERRRHFLELSQTTTEMKLRTVDHRTQVLDSVHSQVSKFVAGAKESVRKWSDVDILLRKSVICSEVEKLTQVCVSAPVDSSERDRARFVADTQWLESLGEMVELPWPETSFAENTELVKPVQNEESTLVVVAGNPEGHALIHGGGACSAHSMCVVPSTGCLSVQEADVTDNKDGSYTVGFAPVHPGTTSLEVFFNKQPIQGSPFEFQVMRNFVNLRLESFAFPVANGNPWGVALLGDHELAVTSSDSTVHIYTDRGKLVETIRSNFTRPYGICSGGDSTLWVTDREAHNVQKFQRSHDGDGKFRKVFQFGVRGVSPGQFSHPRGIVVHPTTGLVYVSDMKNHRVQIFAPGDPLPTYRSHFGGPGKTPGLFDLPAGLCFDRHDNLLVCDDRNGRVQVFDREGRYLRLLGATPTRKGLLCSPISVACDMHGRSVVTEFGSHTITFLSPEGEILSCVRSLGAEFGQLVHPRGVACDPLGYVYVADHDNARIVRF